MTPKDRISVTLPPDLIAAADRQAEQLDRSRSWVVAEALRHYLAAPVPRVAGPSVAYTPVPTADATADIADARLRRIVTELALSPEERLRRAEGLGQLARKVNSRGQRRQGIGFENYEDYYNWKKFRWVRR